MRSSYKLLGFDYKGLHEKASQNFLILKKYLSVFKKDNKQKKRHNIFLLCWNSSHIIKPSLLHKKVGLYTGRSFVIFQIRASMLFNRLGSFVRTKKFGMSMHLIKKKKKR